MRYKIINKPAVSARPLIIPTVVDKLWRTAKGGNFSSVKTKHITKKVRAIIDSKIYFLKSLNEAIINIVSSTLFSFHRKPLSQLK